MFLAKKKIMGRPRKYKGLHDRNKKYHSTEKGKAAVKKYRSSDRWKTAQRDRARIRRGTIVNKQQWFVDTYGDPGVALELLDQKEKLVIKYLFGLDGDPPLNQKAIASMMDCSRQWISQLKKKAEKKLAPLKKEVRLDIPPENKNPTNP